MRNQLLKLEEIRRHTGYAFTVNLADPYQYWKDPERMEKSIRYLKKLLSSQHYEYKLYIEVSCSGRIHGHGYIWIHDPYNFCLFDVQNLTERATIVIKEVDNLEVWEDYIIKQSHIVRKIIYRFLPVISPDHIQTKIDDYLS